MTASVVLFKIMSYDIKNILPHSLIFYVYKFVFFMKYLFEIFHSFTNGYERIIEIYSNNSR